MADLLLGNSLQIHDVPIIVRSDNFSLRDHCGRLWGSPATRTVTGKTAPYPLPQLQLVANLLVNSNGSTRESGKFLPSPLRTCSTCCSGHTTTPILTPRGDSDAKFRKRSPKVTAIPWGCRYEVRTVLP
jgi:hypothetical protein